MARIELKGIHRVRRKLADGSFREHHYAWRGGPKFWDSESEVKLNSPEYIAALTAVATSPKPSNYMTPQMVDDYISSAEYRAKKTALKRITENGLFALPMSSKKILPHCLKTLVPVAKLTNGGNSGGTLQSSSIMQERLCRSF